MECQGLWEAYYEWITPWSNLKGAIQLEQKLQCDTHNWDAVPIYNFSKEESHYRSKPSFARKKKKALYERNASMKLLMMEKLEIWCSS